MLSNHLFIGGSCAFLAVAFGAFGAHGLKGLISADMMAVYQTAVTYQMWHALGLLIIAQIRTQFHESKLLLWSGNLMIIGIILFSGSLYLMIFLNQQWLGLITPFGGLSLLTAWLLLAIFAFRQN